MWSPKQTGDFNGFVTNRTVYLLFLLLDGVYIFEFPSLFFPPLSLTIRHPSFFSPFLYHIRPSIFAFTFSSTALLRFFFSLPLLRLSPFLLLMKCEKWSSVGWSGQKFAGLMAWQNESRPSSPSITALRRLPWGSVKVLAYWLLVAATKCLIQCSRCSSSTEGGWEMAVGGWWRVEGNASACDTRGKKGKKILLW